MKNRKYYKWEKYISMTLAIICLNTALIIKEINGEISVLPTFGGLGFLLIGLYEIYKEGREE